MVEHVYVLFDDSQKDPTYAGVDAAFLATVEVPEGEEVERLGETLEVHPHKLYSIQTMLEVLEKHNLLAECLA